MVTDFIITYQQPILLEQMHILGSNSNTLQLEHLSYLIDLMSA